ACSRRARLPGVTARRGGRRVTGGRVVMGVEYVGFRCGSATGDSMPASPPVDVLLLLLQKVDDGHADLRALAAEQGAGHPAVEALLGELVGVRGKGDVADLVDEMGPLLEIERDELLDLGALRGLLLHVDEQ